jgi:hypothetical protein
MTDNTNDPIAEPIRELLTVFKDHLSTVSFPEVSYAIIEEFAEKVTSAAAKLEESRKQVEVAEEAFGLSTEELLQKCSKALAYAKVYAEGNDELLERLSTIQFGKTAKAAKRTVASESPKAVSQPRQKKASTAAEKSEESAVEQD